MAQDVKLSIVADASKAIAEIKRVDGALSSTAAAGDSAAAKVGGGLKRIGDAANNAGAGAAKLRGALSLVSPELGAVAGVAGRAADAVEFFAAANGSGAASAVLLNPAVLAAAAAVGGFAFILYDAKRANDEHAAAVLANTAAIAAAAVVADGARDAIADLSVEWALATGRISGAAAEQTKGFARVDKAFETSIKAADANQVSMRAQMASMEALRDATLKGSSGWNTYNKRVAELRPQLYAAEKAYTGLQGEVGAAKGQVDEIVEAHVLEKRALEDARAAADAKSAAARAAAQAAREHAEAEALLRAQLAEAARIAEQYATGLVALADAGRTASESNLQGIAREEAARARALEALQEQYASEVTLTQGSFARLEAADAAYAKSKEQITAASDERIAAIRLKAADDEQARLDASVAATNKAEQDKVIAVVNTIQSAAAVAGQLFDLGVGYQVDVLRAMEADLQENEENMTATQRKELAKRIDAQRDAALQAFNVAKAAKVAEAIASTALAVINAIAQSPPPSPFGLIGAGIAAAAGAVSVAQIASQEPSFHVGTSQVQRSSMPDEVRATLLEGEAVLSRRAVAENGGRMAIEERNAGRRSGSQGAGRPAPIQYRHREFNEFIRDNIRLGGPLATAINAGDRVGHRKRSSG